MSSAALQANLSAGNTHRVALWLCAAAAALFVVAQMYTPKPNHDVWHQMALARESLKLGHVPTNDLYSYAPTVSPIPDHEWLAGMVALGAFTAAGLNGLTLLWFALTAGLWAACMMGLRGTPAALGIGATAAMAPFVMYSLCQPCMAQGYSSLLAAVTLLIVQTDARAPHRRWLLLCFPVAVLWANLHAGVVIGVAVLAAYAAERALGGRGWLPQLAAAAAMAAAPAASPFGFSYYPYLVRALRMPRPEILEWKPLWFVDLSDPRAWLFIGSAFLLALAIRKKGLFPGSIVTLVLAVLAARAWKNLPFYGIAWLLFVARNVPTPAFSRRMALIAGGVSAAAIPLLLSWVWMIAPWHVVLQSDLRTAQGLIALPVHAADYLERTGFHGNVMTFFRHGGYLSWRLYPKVKVSCDARYDLAYPPRDVEENFEAYLRRPELFRAELARLPQTDLILIDRRMAAKQAIGMLTDWKVVYQDELFTLLSRR